MLQKVKIGLIIVLIINLIAVDVVLYLLWNKSNRCPVGCDRAIGEKINSLPTPTSTSPSPTIMATLTPTPKTIQQKMAQKSKSTQYIPIPGSGSTLENKWVDLTGTEFYISTEDYPNLVGAYFEANMKLVNGNGLAFLRLFDITAGVEVWGSEISANNQKFNSVSSGKLTIRNGTHLYRVQAKSLTADTTVFNSGRIKMILEN